MNAPTTSRSPLKRLAAAGVCVLLIIALGMLWKQAGIDISISFLVLSSLLGIGCLVVHAMRSGKEIAYLFLLPASTGMLIVVYLASMGSTCWSCLLFGSGTAILSAGIATVGEMAIRQLVHALFAVACVSITVVVLLLVLKSHDRPRTARATRHANVHRLGA